MRTLPLRLTMAAMTLALGSPAPCVPPPPLPAAAVVVDEAVYSRLKLALIPPGDARLSVVPGEPESAPQSILRLETLTSASPPYGVKAAMVSHAPINRGDTLWLNFRMRTVESPRESGEGEIEVVLEDLVNYHKCFTFRALADGAWKEFAVPIKARQTLAAGKAEFHLRMGQQKQVVELAGLKLLNYGPDHPRESLPSIGQSIAYAGMEPGASWREEALKRIETVRKSRLEIVVNDTGGQPVAGAKVRVRQVAHHYGFGAAVSAPRLAVTGPETPYQAAVRCSFNIITFENDLKWRQWEQNTATALAAMRWSRQAGLRVRGHTMVWAAWKRVPARLRKLEGDPEALRGEVLRHVADIGARTQGQIADWDVLNEPYTNHDIIDILGQPAMAEWFAAAQKAAPASRLFINDYGVINGEDLKHREHYRRTIAYLREQGAPLHGIGIQGHFGMSPAAPEKVLGILDQFAEFGLPIQMTEFSLDLEEPEISAQYLQDMLTAFYSHPATDAFVLWCFAEGIGWHNSACLYNSAWELTPAGHAWMELVHKQWRTDTEVTTDTDGRAALQAFHGDYELVLGRTVTRTALRAGGGSAEVIVTGE